VTDSNDEGADEFYIIDVRPEWRCQPYVTVWRPNNAGYAYPLSWGGIYRRDELQPGYHANKKGSSRFCNFPVPRAVAERLAVPTPRPGIIDDNTGPVLVNDEKTRRALRAARVIPERSNAIAAAMEPTP
jgi:hypothetical protein